jgi:hypothetical protein
MKYWMKSLALAMISLCWIREAILVLE